jgi:hypothetical protein
LDSTKRSRSGPQRVGRVVAQVAVPQHLGDVGHAHGRARVAGLGLFDRINRQQADRFGHLVGHIGSGRSNGIAHDQAAFFLTVHHSPDEGREDELHGQLHLAAGHHDGVGAAHEGGINHVEQVLEVNALGLGEPDHHHASSALGISRAMNGLEVSTMGTRWKFTWVCMNCGQM